MAQKGILGGLNCGQAATLVLASSLAAKMFMSFGIRVPMVGKPKEEREKLKATPFYINASSAQLNEAEYAPWLAAGLLYLHSRGANLPITATAAALGNVVYFWGRLCAGTSLFSPVGALPRYFSMVSIVWNIYKCI